MSDFENRVLNFIEKTSEVLGSLKTSIQEQGKDMAEIKVQTNKIPAMEVGLNNHLTAHNRIKYGFLYSAGSIVLAGIIMAILHWIVQVF